MGVLISRFRKKKSTVEILEDIEKEITSLQKFRRQNQELQKKFIGSLILYSILLYIGGAVIFYFYYFPNNWKHRLLYSLPLLLFPLLIWCIKKTLHWYFVKRITKNDLALNELREKKKKILEDVMETETYKKAKEILEKFDPNRFKQLEAPAAPATPKISPPGSELRRRPVQQGPVRTPVPQQRGVTPQQTRPGTPAVRPGTTPHIPRSGGMQPRMLATPQPNGLYGRTPGPPLPRSVLPRERTKTDRLLEYLVGDGPQNRYALICKACHSHNGMALKEEFEYLSFRCCYCYHMNQAKKMRPYAPKLEIPEAEAPATGSIENTDKKQGPRNQDKKDGSFGYEDESDDEDEVDDGDENGESSESINSNNDIVPMDTDDPQIVDNNDDISTLNSTDTHQPTDIKDMPPDLISSGENSQKGDQTQPRDTTQK